jgi:hypothetical protein
LLTDFPEISKDCPVTQLSVLAEEDEDLFSFLQPAKHITRTRIAGSFLLMVMVQRIKAVIYFIITPV